MLLNPLSDVVAPVSLIRASALERTCLYDDICESGAWNNMNRPKITAKSNIGVNM